MVTCFLLVSHGLHGRSGCELVSCPPRTYRSPGSPKLDLRLRVTHQRPAQHTVWTMWAGCVLIVQGMPTQPGDLPNAFLLAWLCLSICLLPNTYHALLTSMRGHYRTLHQDGLSFLDILHGALLVTLRGRNGARKADGIKCQRVSLCMAWPRSG